MSKKRKITSIDESIVWICTIRDSDNDYIRFSNGAWFEIDPCGHWTCAPEDMYLELRFEEAIKERPF